MSEEQKEYEYDVALSFAGEDRSYAQSLAAVLKGREIKVFYDEYETAQLWGKDLYEHLSNLYKNEARYCVMFLSQHYAKKQWTTHERKSAQSRAFKENSEYILPIRLDETSIPGIEKTIGYLNGKEKSSDFIANAIVDKLGKQSTRPKFFWDYQFEPEPGRRHWYQLDDQRWIEQYPSGHTTTFVVVDRITKNNPKGVLVRKANGNFHNTLVGDYDIEIFIPDRESREQRLYFRNRFDENWLDWRYAGVITYK